MGTLCRGMGQIGPQGLDWQNLCGGPLDTHIATFYNIYNGGLMVLEICLKKSCPHSKSMETPDPRDQASLDPRGLIGRVFFVQHH